MSATLTLGHPDITTLPQTFLSVDGQAGDTSITVQNANDFSQNQYVLVGIYGDPQAEILPITTPNISSTTISVTLAFPHPIDTPVTVIPWNGIRIYRSLTGLGGSYTLLASSVIQVDQVATSYIDFTATDPYSYRYTFTNSNLNIESDYSSEMPYGGFPFYSVSAIQQRVLDLYVDSQAEFITLQSILNWMNELTGRLNREVTDSESTLFANFVTFTPGSSEYTDISSYNVESIFLMEYSGDGGMTWGQDTINPMDFRVKSGNPTSFYSYKLAGDNLFVYGGTQSGNQSFPSNYLVRMWYFTQQSQLVNASDMLPTVYRSYSDVYVDYCMMRANEQSRRLSESAVYYERKFLDGFRSIVESVRGRINQGNKSMANTWLNSFPNW